MIELEPLKKDSAVAVRLDGAILGCVWISYSPFHAQNAYLTFDDGVILPCITEELFQKLFELIKSPLQVLIPSTDSRIADYLASGGFKLMRRCYSMNVERGDLICESGERKRASAYRLLFAKRGDENYAELARVMFEHYKRTHFAINPLTAGFEEFCSALPDEVIFSQAGDALIGFAFIQCNEIAYICGTDKTNFHAFCRALAESLFALYERIEFECDDCDEYAMALRSLFHDRSEATFNTYVYVK